MWTQGIDVIGSTRDAVDSPRIVASEAGELHLQSRPLIGTHPSGLPTRTAGPSAVSSPPGRRSAMKAGVAEAISDCAANKSWSLALVGAGLSILPSQVGDLFWLSDLNLHGNILQKFPSQELLKLSKLSNLRLTMNQLGREIQRKPSGRLKEMGYSLNHVPQGNARAKVVPLPAPEAMALCTTGLGPCLAIMVLQQSQAVFMHVDSPGRGGMYGVPVLDVLRTCMPDPDLNAKVMLVGCNDPGSVGTLRGVLAALQALGLDDKIVMASIGNGHTSVALDLEERCAYCSFG